MRLLFIGDIVGGPGIRAVRELLPGLVSEYQASLVVANGEYAAQGFGLTKTVVEQLFGCGIHVITTGNHVWDKQNILSFIAKEDRLLRPANYPEGAPGKGSVLVGAAGGHRVGILNLSGRVFMDNLDCPFRAAQCELEKLQGDADAVFVDMHAEATSEKISMGWFLDGKVSGVFGTHTHVQTADEKILPRGTAYITDVGMTGAFDSVIGLDKELSLKRFLRQMPYSFKVATDDIAVNAVCVETETSTGKAIAISRIQRRLC